MYIYINITGNLMLNKKRKLESKQKKKNHFRNEKKVSSVTNILDNFSIGMNSKSEGANEAYSFETDFDMDK